MNRKKIICPLCLFLLIPASFLIYRLCAKAAGETAEVPPIECSAAHQDVAIHSGEEMRIQDESDNADAVSEPENTGLMPLFQEGDTLESITERGALIYRTLLKDYERYVIKKYAPLTQEERAQQRKRKNGFMSEEARELSFFDHLWSLITEPRPRGPYPGCTVRGTPSSEDMQKIMGMELSDFFDKASGMPEMKRLFAEILAYEKQKKTSEERMAQLAAEMTEYEVKGLKLSDEQREFINGLIVSKKITSKDPGVLFNSERPLSDEDMAFIEEAVKDNPDIKLPWHDPGWQEEALLRQAHERWMELSRGIQHLWRVGTPDARMIKEYEEAEAEYKELKRKYDAKMEAKRPGPEDGGNP